FPRRSGFEEAGQRTIQSCRKALTIGGAQGGWPTQDEAIRAQLLQQVPYCQALLHVCCSVDVSARTDSQRLLVHHRGSKRHIGRDDKILRCHMRDDVTIDLVRFRRDAYEGY